jgi:hypothetical protein
MANPMSNRTSNNDTKIFDLLRAYHESRENIRLLLDLSDMGDYEKMGFVDAWQEEMADFFARHGYCFACNRRLGRCECEEPIRAAARTTA